MTDEHTAPTSDTGTVDADNPWPGLAAFREADQLYFQGRDASIDALTRLVLRAPLTVLHGVSGLGKTSILRAGLFPRLRREFVLPIYVRLSHADESAPLVDQVWEAIAAAAHSAQVETPPVPAGFTLWEYFHRKDIRFWDVRNRIVTPLLVFDQFEELFTLGRATAARRARTDAFLAALSDLVAGRPAAEVRARLEHSPDEALLFSMTDQPCKVLLSLREDFLPDLAELRRLMPAVTETMHRLQPMTTAEALRVVEVGGDLVDADTAQRIVRFVASAHDEAGADEVIGSVEPALLSVFCRELNNTRRAHGRARITADLLEGSRTAIIADFYERTISTDDLSPAARVFVEERLLTESGFRDSVAEEQALRTPGVRKSDIDTLIGRRLLRREDAGTRGRARLELTHDVLAEAVRVSRDRRRLREQDARALAERRKIEERARRDAEAAAARAQERREFDAAQTLAAKEREAAQLAQALARLERRSRQRQIALLSVLLALTGTAAWFSWNQAQLARRAEVTASRALSAADVARVTRGEPWALAYLARAVRTDPDATMARALLLAHLSQQVLPLSELAHGTTVTSATLNAPGTHVLVIGENGKARIWDGHGAASTLDATDVTTAAFSPDGRRVLTASASGRTDFWETDTSTQVGMGLQHQTGVISVAFDPTGTRVLSISVDGDAAVWSATTGDQLAGFGVARGELQGVIQASFSPDGSRVLAILFDGTARVFDADTGRPTSVVLRETNPIFAALFDPTGRRVVTTSSMQASGVSEAGAVARLWDARTGARTGVALAHDDWVNTVAFSPDGTWLVTASRNQAAQVWDVLTGAPVGAPLRHARPVVQASFSHDGQRVLTAAEDGTAQIWDPRTSREVGRPLRHDSALLGAAFSVDGTTILTTTTAGTMRLWDARTGTVLETPLWHGDGLLIDLAAFSADGTRVATAGSLDARLPDAERQRRRNEAGAVRLWDVATGQAVAETLLHDGGINAVEFSPVGPSRLVTASDDHTARLWDGRTGTPVGAALTHAGPVYAASFSRDGQQVVTASADGTARVWDASSGQPVGPSLGHDSEVQSATFSPDGTLVATGTADGQMHLWHTGSGQRAATLCQGACTDAVGSVAFSPDGARVLASSNTSSVLWDVATRTPLLDRIAHAGAVRPPVFGPDGTSMVTSSSVDGGGVWDISRSVPVLRWSLERGDDVVAAAFSRDGRLVTASADGTARLWHARTRQQVGLPLRHDSAVRWATFSPDDTRVLTLAGDGIARLWDVPAGGRDDQPLLADLAEAVGAHTVDESGGVVRLDEWPALRDGLRTRVEGATTSSPLATRVGRWIFSDPWTRTISPLSSLGMDAHVRAAAARSEESRVEMQRRVPGHPALARATPTPQGRSLP